MATISPFTIYSYTIFPAPTDIFNTFEIAIFYRLKLYFNVCALILYVCEGSSQAITHAKNYVINIFEYKGHDLWHTRYVCVSGWYQT